MENFQIRHPGEQQHKSMHKDGYTLIELLVAVAIIAVLTGILTASYRGATETSDLRQGQMHAQSVRMALNTALASNPQLTTTSLGTINCTVAQDVGSAGITASNGGNGWEAAPSGSTCTATPLTARTYKVTVTLSGGQTAVAP